MDSSADVIVDRTPLLPPKTKHPHGHPILLGLVVILALVCLQPVLHVLFWPSHVEPFYSQVKRTSIGTEAHAGYIGIEGDETDGERRSFFMLFPAKQSENGPAPLILSIGGGPGTSGLVRPLCGEGPYSAGPNGTVLSNPYPWTNKFNLLALDHPIGAGFSYGSMVNSSGSAALDAYDFLQKFYTLFPQLLPAPLVISAGSHGGIYVPHIATVIHEQNQRVRRGKGRRGAQHINLQSLILSDPLTDVVSYFRSLLFYRCSVTSTYDTPTCTDLYNVLPECLEQLEYLSSNDTLVNRRRIYDICAPLEDGDVHDRDVFDIRRNCTGSTSACHPQFAWVQQMLDRTDFREDWGIPDGVKYQVLSPAVNRAFDGDQVQRAHFMYEPLLRDGIRILHVVGAQDANSPYPGTLAFLKLVRSEFQEGFRTAPDLPWPEEGVATVRTVGHGAGSLAFVLVNEAGHFVGMDQPKLFRDIVTHWIENKPFF